jgi:NADH dehydrogenase FAD-containing subunit
LQGLTWPKNFKPKGDSGNSVDKNNYNFFPPLIYQVATAFWNHPVSVIPFSGARKRTKVTDNFLVTVGA